MSKMLDIKQFEKILYNSSYNKLFCFLQGGITPFIIYYIKVLFYFSSLYTLDKFGVSLWKFCSKTLLWKEKQVEYVNLTIYDYEEIQIKPNCNSFHEFKFRMKTFFLLGWKELSFCHKSSNFLIPLSSQLDHVNLLYFKLYRLFSLTEFIVWNIWGLK